MLKRMLRLKMKKHFNVKITGLVQGVFFRTSAKDKALEFKVNGFARNELDGSLYIEAEGEEDNLNRFLAWCHDGPKSARVKNIEISEAEMMGFFQFSL